jgi:hypothetical protein
MDQYEGAHAASEIEHPHLLASSIRPASAVAGNTNTDLYTDLNTLSFFEKQRKAILWQKRSELSHFDFETEQDSCASYLYSLHATNPNDITPRF